VQPRRPLQPADSHVTINALEMALNYIEVFYNQRRRHSTIGQISPAAYERRAIAEGMDVMENGTTRLRSRDRRDRARWTFAS